VLSSVVKHINGRSLSVLCLFVRCKIEEGGVSNESTGKGPGAEQYVKHINGQFLSVLCIFVRCKEEEESVNLLGRVQVLSSVVKHING
jgi:hypothetical protein